MRDQPDALYAVLSPFRRHGISMNRIESRPSHAGRWQYAFAELGEYAADVRVPGSYPVALL